ncbi:hypothetical protein GCM10010912_17400 [Paenibacillus albidus]|uniref:Uncharacterized protein n=1 Tax=Paenibacillus albidus TaxID=2041023 RepID=A0A917C567_9BACL|nr:hypothetical protein [Paenibacillus albidus]GGF72713.1 hypothetical protein GCM10010912_17400 [Paenibacillus albidus]
MALNDVLAMQVPSGVLKQILKNEKLDKETKLSVIEDMAKTIADKKPVVGQEIADQFQYAGATAVNVHMIMSDLSPDWQNKEFFKDFLIKKFSGALFGRGLRPELDSEPKLIKATEVGDRMVLAFSYLGSPRRYLENYEIVIRKAQVLDYVVIHFSPFAVEVRASQSQNRVFKSAMLDIMEIQDTPVWEKLTKLTETQARELAIKLNAKLRAAKHKMTEGAYATKEVTASTQVLDLEDELQYQEEFGNQPMKKKTLTFNFTYSFGFEDEISYVITDEGLWFRSNVGEEAIQHVFDLILKIKFATVESTDEEVVTEEELDSPSANI